MDTPLQLQAAGYLGEHERPVPVRHGDASVEYAVDTSACLITAALQTVRISPAGCRGSSAEDAADTFTHMVVAVAVCPRCR
jgi:hypothetical protein